MSQYRKGEEEKTRFRADRIFTVDEGFYFSTREGKDVGPYIRREDTEEGIELYIKYLNNEVSADKFASKVAVDGLWASTNFN